TSYDYDSVGRLVCTRYALRPVAVPTAAPCASNPTEGPSYTLAARTRYGFERYSDHAYRTVSTLAADQNTGDPTAREQTQLLDAAGRLRPARDAYGDWRHYSYDPLGRLRRVAQSDRADPSHPVAWTTVTYDLLGRPVRRDDASQGAQVLRYLPSGRIA